MKRKGNLQVIATKRNLDDIAKHPGGPGRGVLALLVRDPEGKAPFSNVDYRRQAILAELHGRDLYNEKPQRKRQYEFSGKIQNGFDTRAVLKINDCGKPCNRPQGNDTGQRNPFASGSFFIFGDVPKVLACIAIGPKKKAPTRRRSA